MSDPRLLILDEPCAGLDPIARERFLQFLERVANRPDAPALVLVTHHVEEIFPCFTHALLLRDGAVVAAGPIPVTLTSLHLSRTLGSPVRLARSASRYTLTVRPQADTSWDPKPARKPRRQDTRSDKPGADGR